MTSAGQKQKAVWATALFQERYGASLASGGGYWFSFLSCRPYRGKRVPVRIRKRRLGYEVCAASSPVLWLREKDENPFCLGVVDRGGGIVEVPVFVLPTDVLRREMVIHQDSLGKVIGTSVEIGVRCFFVINPRAAVARFSLPPEMAGVYSLFFGGLSYRSGKPLPPPRRRPFRIPAGTEDIEME